MKNQTRARSAMTEPTNGASETDRYQIGEWRVDPKGCVILRNGTRNRISPRSMSVLVYLAQRAGEAVTHDELLNEFWRGATSSRNAVHKCITELRQAFANGDAEAAYITTIAKRGYRLIAPVSSSADADGAVERSKSIAVLRFRNVDGQPGDDLADRMAAALLVGLRDVAGLVVADHECAFPDTIGNQTVQEVGRALGVTYLLDGHVQKLSEQLCVFAALYRCSNGERLHVYRDEQPIAKVREIQDRLVANILTALDVHLDERRAAKMRKWGTQNVDAYLTALEGDAFHMRLDQKSLRYAVERFRAAVALDPRFVQAYSFLAWTLSDLHSFTSGEERRRVLVEELAQLRDEVRRVPANSQALYAIDVCERRMTAQSWPDVEAVARAAIQRNGTTPNDISPYITYVELLQSGHLFREAAQFIDRCEQIDPEEEAIVQRRKAIASLTLGPERTIPMEKKSLMMFQNDISGLSTLVTHLALIGDYREAEGYLARLEENDHAGAWTHAMRLRLAALRGDLTARSPQLAAALDHPRVSDYLRGVTHFTLGDVESGVDAWRRTLGSNSRSKLGSFSYAVHAETCYTEAVIDDPRYQDVLDEVGVGRQWSAYLIEKVAELAPITGIEPSDPSPQRVFLSR
jgi:DNA-binding winged helix-turn-helix (wHTH) protein/tetratricopeptide (TPR) repeat protein